LLWEPPSAAVEPPPGQGPVVLVAPSTAQDPSHVLLRAALEGLAREPVRVIATWNGREPASPLAVPPNAVAVDWLSYSKTMPACDLVVTHGGHGTLMRALASGCPVVISPAGGDMAENAARVDWAGLGVRLPRRLCTPRGVRLAVRRALRLSGGPVDAVARWIAAHDARERACEEIERWAPTRSGTP
jgi:UDP:flavonoid glycosyltransferase YjiC (YdhE family)